VDADGDGHDSDVDCDDADASVYPGATEACDGIDTDCDGNVSADEIDDDIDGFAECAGDCDDTNPLASPAIMEMCDSIDNDCDGDTDEEDAFGCDDHYPDLDGDGFGDPADEHCLCAATYPYTTTTAGDCDDGNPFVHPGVAEDCNGVDDDCDGALPADETDDDGDGELVCDGDCDDTDPLTYPWAAELCDGVDNDCNGLVPANETDGDGDGWMVCDADCDDGDATAYPGATELCDGVDNDCDGTVPADEDDGDGDGVLFCDADCDDGDADNWPGNAEDCGDGGDNDCDGAIDGDDAECQGPPDLDGDGWDETLDCDDNDADLNWDDLDGDGYATCDLDCDDADAGVNPGEAEVAGDGVDNDCDGDVDEAAADAPLGGINVADAHAKLLGEYLDDYAGVDVSGAGDVNGDGYDDILVGASESDREVSNGGCAYLVHGPVSGTIDLGTADAFMVGDASYDGAGRRVSAGGDIDGDGNDDLLVGAHGYTYDHTDQGAVFVVYGPVSGTHVLSTSDAVLTGEDDYDNIGNGTVTGAGDVNDDGYDDVLIGSTNANNYRGRVYLVYGPVAPGIQGLASADAQFDGGLNDAAGCSIGLGDVDADGFDDVYIGAYAQREAYLMYGGAGYSELQGTYTLASDAHATFDSSFWMDYSIGRTGALGGDSNGDGAADILIGDQDNGQNMDATGAVFIVDGAVGGGPTGDVDLSVYATMITGVDPGDGVASSLDYAGDVNGDGNDDILFKGEGTELTYLVYGPVTADMDIDTADAWFEMEHSGDGTGDRVAPAGDVNADGYDDFLLAARYDDEAASDAGAVYLILGGAPPPDADGDGWDETEDCDDGDPDLNLDDLDGDGYSTCDDDCDDGDAAVNPGAVEVIGDGVDNDCDGDVDEAAAPTGDLGLSDAHAKLVGELTGDYAGSAVAGPGDVNGDGYADLLVGAYHNDRGGSNSGCAYLVHGPLSGTVDLSAADAFLVGANSSDEAGRTVEVAGDVNGDGDTDFLVGAPGYDDAYNDQGAVHVVHGPVTGWFSLSGADATLVGEAGNDQIGTRAIGAAGDVDGDGQGDVLVGHADANGGMGVAYLLYGPLATGVTSLASADGRVEGINPGDQIGSAVGGNGDVDGDGYDDFLVGATGASEVYLYQGAAGAGAPAGTLIPAYTADAIVVNNHGYTHALGSTALLWGDADGDGRQDVLVADYTYGNLANNNGAAMLTTDLPSGTFDLDPNGVSMMGADSADWTAYDIDFAGDVNGDGLDDILIGSWNGEVLGYEFGAAYLLYSPIGADLDMDSADASFSGETSYDYAGRAVAGLGDVNGDGYDDILIGAHGNDAGGDSAGAAYIWLGGAGP